MLPHSLSQPPSGPEPMNLDEALSPETVKHILETLQAGSAANPSSLSHTDLSTSLAMSPPGNCSTSNDEQRHFQGSTRIHEAVSRSRGDEGSNDRSEHRIPDELMIDGSRVTGFVDHFQKGEVLLVIRLVDVSIAALGSLTQAHATRVKVHQPIEQLEPKYIVYVLTAPTCTRTVHPASETFSMPPAKHWASFSSATDQQSGSSHKRQKTCAEMPTTTHVDSASKKLDANKNAHLKGRRRFKADFADAEEECKEGFASCRLQIKQLRPGDEEGSFEVVIANEAREHVVTVNFLIPDTTEYPKEHTLFCYASDGDIPPRLQEVIQELATEPSHPVRETLLILLSRLSRALGLRPPQITFADDSGDETEEVEDDDDEDYTILSDDEGGYNLGSFTVSSVNQHDFSIMQRDFLELIAADYRPGFIKHSAENFTVSVSISILELSKIIPPRALMAWDRALLSKTQHLNLLISGFGGVYPVLNADGTYTVQAIKASTDIQFRIGLTQRYKPGKEEAKAAFRKHGLVLEEEQKDPAQGETDPIEQMLLLDQPLIVEEEENYDPSRFDAFSLSSSLEALMNQSFLKLVQYRRSFGLTWAGAEKLLHEVEKSQNTPEQTLSKFQDDIIQAEDYENQLMRTVSLFDPLQGLEKGSPINLPLSAFCYLVRRLLICPQYCLVCHRKLESSYEALKPYVCDSKLCAYQYYALNRGAPLEYEIIHNPHTVDLLVSIAYSAAVEGVLEEPPIGMGLRVPLPKNGTNPASHLRGIQPVTTNASDNNPLPIPPPPQPGVDGLVEFDELDLPHMRSAIVTMLDSLPTVIEMRQHLMKKVEDGKKKPKLQDINYTILPAAWLILRWCVASCTAYLEEITNPNELVRGLDKSWRQFRFNVGAPDAEAKFTQAVEQAQAEDKRAREYPVLYAFHGSPLRNWHSIIRHGLWFKIIANGRAFGNGVYLAKDGSTSTGHYAMGGQTWPKSMIAPTNCVALVEAVNLPKQFVSSNPHFVIDKTHWILCRYLLVKGREIEYPGTQEGTIPFVKLDKTHPCTMRNSPIQIPEPSYKIEKLIQARREEVLEEDNDDDDQIVFNFTPEPPRTLNNSQSSTGQTTSSAAGKRKIPPEQDWKHDEEYVRTATEHLLPPPEDSSPSATMALQRELRSTLKEQDNAPSLKELGWYMPPEFNQDNLFQWIIEMHSFDPDIPIAKDLQAKKINSIVFEIRFPATFPISPPFFRILRPRFLPFIQGGGGHVTAGGSICMDLLTADGWSPSYSIPAVLMQIKLAISNLDPRPARLDRNRWETPYQMREALEGYQTDSRSFSSVEHGDAHCLFLLCRRRFYLFLSLLRVVSLPFDVDHTICTHCNPINCNMNESVTSAPTTSKRDVNDLPPDTLAFAERIFEAARTGDSELLLSAVDAGLPVNLTNHKGNTLLMLAAYAGQTSLVNELLKRNADPDRLNDLGQSIIAGAVFKAHDDIVKALVEKNANPRIGTPTAIQTALMFGRTDILDMLGATEEDRKVDVPKPPSMVPS
ncbi:hypothetical protein NP233_g10827 [Leucocoprinus birnbaumii]|uniref:UBC core domain-containing protein n=1 Tax=Leucocoprinus birnbaumii TaxID=56174 RepID=A0AAD5YPG9_9AGAR|nr:hypothetical protein NP233_g10827 [Leucocoprinus birnbaumii]